MSKTKDTYIRMKRDLAMKLDDIHTIEHSIYRLRTEKKKIATDIKKIKCVLTKRCK